MLDGVPLLILIVLLAPYVPNVLPWISALGLVAFVGLFLGFLYHHHFRSTSATLRRSAPRYSVPVPLDGFKSFIKSVEIEGGMGVEQDSGTTPMDALLVIDTSMTDWEEPPLKRLQRAIATAVCQLGLKILGEPAFEAFGAKNKEAQSKALLTRLLQPRAKFWASFVADWYMDQKRSHLEAKLWIQLWSLILQFVKQYKRIRREVLKDNLSGPEARRMLMARKANNTSAGSAGPSSSNLSKSGAAFAGDAIASEKVESQASNMEYYQQHLDDFNAAATDDEGIAPWELTDNASSPEMAIHLLPRDNLDELNSQVAMRMAALGILHPAVGSGDQEKEYLRLIIDQLWASFGSMDTEGGEESPYTAESESDGRQNPLLRVLSRELLTNQFIWPLIDKWTQPDFLNQFLIDKVGDTLYLWKTYADLSA